MAEHDPKPAEHKPAPRATATATATSDEPVNPDEVEINENYIGVDPIYANSAYEEPLTPEGADVSKDASPEEKKAAEEAAKAEAEMIDKVKENEEACKVEIDEVTPFEEWVETTDAANRKSNVSGVDQERVEADQQATEDAKNDKGRIAPHSTSTGQPGVKTAL